MKFVFNDSLTASISVNDEELTDTRFVPSDIILEKKIVTSATINNIDDLFDAVKGFKTEAELENFISSNTEAQAVLKDPKNLAKFTRKVSGLFNSGKPSSGSDPVSMATQALMEGAGQAGQPASKFAPFISQKDQIIARLKPFMSDKEIGEIFYRFSEELKLSFTETIGILEFCIQQSRSCNSRVKDLINFYLEHYGQKRQSANTKRIIQTACEYQKLNPTVDIFSVLRDAVAGNQPKVGLGYLSKDPDAQLVFNNLIMLSQASLPEQDEEIRRRFQSSRDALQNQEQKINMQRAIFDMMKTEEMNLQLSKLLQGVGTAFEALLTQPMYRALRSLYYDINAGKILMNQATGIFGADTSPETKRTQFDEQQIENENNFPSIRDTKTPFSNNQYNFLKLASPEVTRHIFAQTAPTTQAPTKPTPEQEKQISNALNEVIKAITSTSADVLGKLSDYAEKLGDLIKSKALDFIGKIGKIFNALKGVVTELLRGLATNSLSQEKIESEFMKVIALINGGSGGNPVSNTVQGIAGGLGLIMPGGIPAAIGAEIGTQMMGVKPGTSTTPQTAPQTAPTSPVTSPKFTPPPGAKLRVRGTQANNRYNRVAQRSPQLPGTTYAGGNRTTQYIYNAIGIVSSIGTMILLAINGPRLLAAALDTGEWVSIINAIAPLIGFIKTNLIELFMSFNLVGGNAPSSSMFFDRNGRVTATGLQVLVNNQEAMIALGLSDEDAMALSKFAVQKEVFMQQLRAKESNLQNAESQAVQTGNPRQPETTVGDLPVDFQNKLKDFLDFCGNVENQFKAAINLFRNAINANQKNYNDVQKMQSSGKLAEFERDLLEVQTKKSEWSSMKNIAAHMMRKRVLLQKLKPLQTQLDTMKKLGIPMSNIIASPNGILAQVGRIRSEEQQALEALRKEYYEKLDLLKNPDKIAPLTKYPMDTGVTKLPESPDQKESTESPFTLPENSQFSATNTPENSSIKNPTGAK
jgi:hypothetical protein